MARWWDNLVGPPREGGVSDDADIGLTNRMFQEDHAAKLKAQGRGNGRTHVSLGTNTINQTDHMEREFREMAEPVAKALHKTSPTRAHFEYGRPSHWNLNEMTTTTFTADKPHGMPTGYRESVRGGVIEVTSNREVKFTR